MSFEANIPKHIKEVEATIDKARRKQWELNAKLHDCDCEFCDRQELELSDEDQKEYDKLEATITEGRATLKRLKEHAKVHKIEVPA
jgi:hypothetical protein